MARHKDGDWVLNKESLTWEQVQVAVLMDIRDELKALNRVMACPNVMAGFVALQSIDRTLKRTDKRLAKKVKLK